MSKVYNFDDKILQLDSVQLKRTNDVLDSREEAVEALLNYSGDITKDGMPLLARYWSDETHTEIKHLRGYIHNVNGKVGISIDDEGGEGDEKCKVTYWDTKYMHDEEIPVTEAFDTRNGAYESAYIELHGSDDDYLDGKHGTGMIRQDKPLIYITAVKDERRRGRDGDELAGAEWYGSLISHDKAKSTTPYYSVLTIFNTYSRERKPDGPGDTTRSDPFYKGVVLDPRKYEKKIHKALYFARDTRMKQCNYVIKKAVPLYPNPAHKYYFQGNVIKFMIPIICFGCKATLKFPKNMRGYTTSFDALRRHWFYSGNIQYNYYDLVMSGDVVFTWNYDDDKYNILTIQNNSDMVLPLATLLVECTDYPCNIVLSPKTDSREAFQAKDNNGSYYNCYLGGGEDDYEYDYSAKYNVYQSLNLTTETTSPGFRIEGGKVKCYKSSDFSSKLKEMSVQPKYVKDGTSLYYNIRNITNCGIGSRTVSRQRDFVNGLICGSNDYGSYLFKDKGRIEYLGTVRRRYIPKYWVEGQFKAYDTICVFTSVAYAGPVRQENGKYLFKVKKTKSYSEVYMPYIGVSFIGTDGDVKEGRFTSVTCQETGEHFVGSEEGIYNLELDGFEMKMKNGKTVSYVGYGNLDSSFDGSMKVIYIKFNGSEHEKPLRYIVTTDIDMDRSYTWSKTKWKVANVHLKSYPCRDFTKNLFNKCRYFKKYKGVISEFPETFYTR